MQRAALSLGHGLDLLGNVFKVGFSELARPQQFGILPGPLGKIDVVQLCDLHIPIIPIFSTP